MCSGAPNYLGDGSAAKCGDVYRDFGLDPVIHDAAYSKEMINYDITSFNNVLNASLTIFQTITLEGWSQLMYNYQDTYSYATSSIFFCLVIIIGAFISLNLVLAMIMHSYLRTLEMDEQRKQEEKKAEAGADANVSYSEHIADGKLRPIYKLRMQESNAETEKAFQLSSGRRQPEEKDQSSQVQEEIVDSGLQHGAPLGILSQSMFPPIAASYQYTGSVYAQDKAKSSEFFSGAPFAHEEINEQEIEESTSPKL